MAAPPTLLAQGQIANVAAATAAERRTSAPCSEGVQRTTWKSTSALLLSCMHTYCKVGVFPKKL